jgi:hypothetical protein
MLKEEKNSIYDALGKMFLVSAAACASFVLIKSYLHDKKEKDIDAYQERLRQAYEGLSPEDIEKTK